MRATASRTAACLCGATPAVPLSTRETVLGETPAARAMSRMVICLVIFSSIAHRRRDILSRARPLAKPEIEINKALDNPWTERYSLGGYFHKDYQAEDTSLTIRAEIV